MNSREREEKRWSGAFGDAYIGRSPHTGDEMNSLYQNLYGITRSELNSIYLRHMFRWSSILEVGCGVGVQLELLAKDGFTDLWGIDISKTAIDVARENPSLASVSANLMKGSVFDLPASIGDKKFDIVFTSGLLIHLQQEEMELAMEQIYNASSRYIWGFEYYTEAPTCNEIPYRGEDHALYKANYPCIYMNKYPELELKMYTRLPYLESSNEDIMFLLRKGDEDETVAA